MFATASPARSSTSSLLDGLDGRRRVRLGFAATHPTVVVGLAMGADATTGLVGAALLALHGLVELHWLAADRLDEPAGIAAAAVYDGPS